MLSKSITYQNHYKLLDRPFCERSILCFAHVSFFPNSLFPTSANYGAPERTSWCNLVICPDGLINCPDELINRPDDLLIRPDNLLICPDALINWPDELINRPDDLLIRQDNLLIRPDRLLNCITMSARGLRTNASNATSRTILSTKSNVASTVLLVWTGFYAGCTHSSIFCHINQPCRPTCCR